MDSTSSSSRISAAGVIGIIAVVLAVVALTIGLVALFYPQSATSFTTPVTLSNGFTSSANSTVNGTLTASNLAVPGSATINGAIVSVAPAFLASLQLNTLGGTPSNLSFYQEDIYTSNTTGAFTLTNVQFRITRIGNIVTMNSDAYSNNISVGGVVNFITALAPR